MSKNCRMGPYEQKINLDRTVTILNAFENINKISKQIKDIKQREGFEVDQTKKLRNLYETLKKQSADMDLALQGNYIKQIIERVFFTRLRKLLCRISQ